MEEGLLRMRGARKVSRADTEFDRESHDTNEVVDYSNALLYLAAIQLITATVTSSFVAIIGCALVPTSLVSAVRTLTLTMVTATIFVYQPLRIGRVRGLDILFAALRPCVFIYVISLIVEQLTHACARDAASPSWRRILVHGGSFVQLMAGFIRARNPMSETDLPFLLVVATLILLAMLPPPAVVLAGPLCNSPSLWTAAERMLRAFCFSILYCVFTFCSNLPNRATNELILCVCRAASASLWVLACHSYLLVLVIPQGVLAVYFRIQCLQKAKVDDDDPEVGTRLLDAEEEAPKVQSLTKKRVAEPPPPVTPEAVGGGMNGTAGLLALNGGLETTPSNPSPPAQHASDNGVIRSTFSGFGARPLLDISQASGEASVGVGGTHPGDLSKEEIARIAESM